MANGGKTIVMEGDERLLPRPESEEARKLEAELLRGATHGPELHGKDKVVRKKGKDC